jgi:hypothetical protein
MLSCTYLELAKKRKSIDNVIVLNTDIKDVERYQIVGDISVIRVNNVWRYVGDFYQYIEKYKAMIMQDGVFLFQEYSEYKLLIQENSPYKVYNIPSYFIGWEQKCILNSDNGKIFDSLIYKK